MKTILIRSQGSLQQWVNYASRAPRGLVLGEIDQKLVLTMIGKIMRIVQSEWLNTRCDDHEDERWFYRVPERGWNLIVLAHPEILQFFEAVDDENNIN